MTTHPYIPFYVDDYEAATTHLTIEEDGAYNRLLRLCWRTPGCSLPDDDAWIARKIRLSPDDFQRIAKPVLTEFFTPHRGRLIQRRLKLEYDDISRKKTARKNAGKKGGDAKALKTKEKPSSNASVLPADTRAFQNHTQTQNQNQNQSQIIELEPLRASKSVASANDDAFDRFWSAYPSKVAKAKAKLAFPKALKKIPIDGMLMAIDHARQFSPKWRENVICNPATWLNGERWNDEFPNVPNFSAKGVQRHDNFRRAFAGAAAFADTRDDDI